jgi:peroxiredoxin
MNTRRRRIGSSVSIALAVVAAVAATSPSLALSPGGRAPALELRALDGAPVSLASLRGQVVVVDFWASWCEPCAEALPALDRLHARYRDQGLAVIGVNVDRNASDARGFLRRSPVSFPVVHDARQQIVSRWEPERMPSSFIVDRGGVVRHVHGGFRSGDAARIERIVRDLL